MKERGMIFKGDLVKAILDGRKVQTRRPVKAPQSLLDAWEMKSINEAYEALYIEGNPFAAFLCAGDQGYDYVKSPYGVVGDRIWVRETFCHKLDDNEMFVYNADGNEDSSCCYYRADGDDICFPIGWGWTPSIHMPRWASRITLEITDVRVERVQEISEEDVLKEGIEQLGDMYHADGIDWPYANQAFSALWDSIYLGGEYTWEANPWVWVYDFKRIDIEKG